MGKEQKQTAEKHNRVFCQIREGMLEAIELEKNCLVDHVPIDMGPDPSMDSPERFAKRPPEATFIPAGSASRDAYGHRYGSELLELDDVMLDKLQQGQQLAVEICQGEYILFVQYRSKEINIHEKCALRQGDDSMRQLRQRFIREKGSNGSFTVLPFGTKGSRYSILL